MFILLGHGWRVQSTLIAMAENMKYLDKLCLQSGGLDILMLVLSFPVFLFFTFI